jgi:hypothetical protein
MIKTKRCGDIEGNGKRIRWLRSVPSIGSRVHGHRHLINLTDSLFTNSSNSTNNKNKDINIIKQRDRYIWIRGHPKSSSALLRT